MLDMIYYLSFALLVISIVKDTCVNGHGRMLEPPARNTLWRAGFLSPPNYEDSELFCGGLKVQWQDNMGKCGVCGDPFNKVRVHETGGKMALNITTRTYSPGSQIDVIIDLVANHRGNFTFQMCWRNNTSTIETEDCFEPLKLRDNKDFYQLSTDRRGRFNVAVQLPAERECQRCILRWQWVSANNWGRCADGKERVGCGPQETYRNCADIRVSHEYGIRGPLSRFVEDQVKIGKRRFMYYKEENQIL